MSETKDTVELLLESGQLVKVDLRDEAYNGPEAMTLKGPGDFYAVWN